MRPAWEAIGAAYERAADAGRGLTGTLRAAFTGAAAGQLLAGVEELFRSRVPGCEVVIREAQPGEVAAWLRDGEVDVVLTTLPVPGADAGPVLVREALVAAVPAGHPFARRESVGLADLERVTVVELAGGRAAPGSPGPRAATLHEALTLVGAGRGVLLVGGRRRGATTPALTWPTCRYATRPGSNGGWCGGPSGETGRVRAFGRAAVDLLSD
ncbi:LysR substrate-binding domain-containing protein [Nonomuraea ferruginea]